MKHHGGWGNAVNLELLFRFFVGVDWASQEHTISILDGNRKEMENKAYPHTGAGLNQLANRLTEPSGDSLAAVAIDIETPHGAVVQTMVERGFAVFPFRKCSRSVRASMNPGSGAGSRKRPCRSKPPSHRRRRSSEYCPLIAFGESAD